MKFLILFIFFLFSSLLASSLQEAQRSLEEGNYQKAKAIYLDLSKKSESMNPSIYYNLGWSSYRLQQLGEAIFYFRKAKNLWPYNSDINYNLEFLRKKTQDKITSTSSFREMVVTVPLSDTFLVRSLSVLMVLICGLSLVGFYKKPQAFLVWTKRVAIILFIPFGLITFMRGMPEGVVGVVTAKESFVYSGPGRDNIVLFTLHEGAELNIFSSSSLFHQITLKDGKKGWIKASDVISDWIGD